MYFQSILNVCFRSEYLCSYSVPWFRSTQFELRVIRNEIGNNKLNQILQQTLSGYWNILIGTASIAFFIVFTPFHFDTIHYVIIRMHGIFHIVNFDRNYLLINE